MNEILQGDCLEVMKSFPDNYFSGVCTDPPYGLHFMGKDWDCFSRSKNTEDYQHFTLPDSSSRKGTVRSIMCGNSLSGTYDDHRNDEFQSFITQFGIEAMRIVKPGGHMLMCGAPRRYHRQACGLEDAGWEIRDCLCWLTGQGFPKSHNHFGPEGYGTALKPAYEPILLCMKPLEGTFKQNYEKWGVGGINIDKCRIPGSKTSVPQPTFDSPTGKIYGMKCGVGRNGGMSDNTKGRWPSNLLLDSDAAAMLDEQSGVTTSSGGDGYKNSIFCSGKKTGGHGLGDSGGASRFFFCPKTSSRERNEGLEGLPDQIGGGLNATVAGDTRTGHITIQKNNHPTVKPLALMRYLITLISPPTNALILDPFAGSGSTIIAAEQLGIKAIGIEKQPEYVEIARARLKHAADKVSKATEQMSLF